MLPICSCCSDRLIRHIRQGALYWWCHSCWLEMPNLEEVNPLIGPRTEEIPIQASRPLLFPSLQDQVLSPQRSAHLQRRSTNQVA